MGNYNNYEDEFVRADARERELERQLSMKDSTSAANNAQGGSSPFYGYQNVPNNGFQYNTQTDGYDYSPYYDKNGKPISPRSARNIITVLSVVFFVIAMFLLVLMFIIVHSMRMSYARCSADVQGVVVDNVFEHNDDDGTYYPVFKYEYHGKSFEQKSTSGRYPAQYRIGDRVIVHVNPDDPGEYYVDKDDGIVIMALSVLSGAFLVLGVMFVIVSVKSKRNERNSMMQ